MLRLGFKNRKSLIKKFIQGKDVTVTNVLSCYGHVSIKKANHLLLNNHFVPLLKLLMSKENKLNENMDIAIEKKLEACVKSSEENM